MLICCSPSGGIWSCGGTAVPSLITSHSLILAFLSCCFWRTISTWPHWKPWNKQNLFRIALCGSGTKCVEVLGSHSVYLTELTSSRTSWWPISVTSSHVSFTGRDARTKIHECNCIFSATCTPSEEKSPWKLQNILPFCWDLAPTLIDFDACQVLLSGF